MCTYMCILEGVYNYGMKIVCSFKFILITVLCLSLSVCHCILILIISNKKHLLTHMNLLHLLNISANMFTFSLLVKLVTANDVTAPIKRMKLQDYTHLFYVLLHLIIYDWEDKIKSWFKLVLIPLDIFLSVLCVGMANFAEHHKEHFDIFLCFMCWNGCPE